MSKEIYIVVAVDVEAGTWRIDDDVFMARFDENKGTYNYDTDDWEDTDWGEYVKATEIIKGEN